MEELLINYLISSLFHQALLNINKVNTESKIKYELWLFYSILIYFFLYFDDYRAYSYLFKILLKI